MDLDRPHHRTTTTNSTTSNSELFICFTSRLSSSSSMKISKSILSPGRVNSRDQPMSLPTSLSRRLRTNGSIKGGQASPMFPTTSKKRGCGYENPEPSSPKVTCIGQVRVKTKKKAAAAKKHTHTQMRSLSRRRSNGGEVSFRRLEDGLSLKCEDKVARYCQQQQQQNSQECLPHRNQRWVHLPLTICEALRAFGAEFSCLFPCGSWCFSASEREKEEKGNVSSRDGQQSSCGAVFARWLVTLQDGEGGKEREIELVVGEDEESNTSPRMMDTSMTSSIRRRHVLEDFDVNGEIFEAKGHSGGGNGGGGCGRGGEKKEEVEEGRASICVPPKNALLLMRCRSDPVKMAALTNRFWEAPPPPDPQDEVDGDEEDSVKVEQVDVQECKEDIDEVIKLKVDDKVEESHQIDEQVEILGKEEHESPMEDQIQDVEKTEIVLEEKLEECNEHDVVQDEVIEQVQETQLVDEEEEEIEVNSLEKKEEQESNEIEEESVRRTSYSSLSSEKEEMEATQAILLAIETALQEQINAEESAAKLEEIESNTENEIQPTTTQLDIETEDSENNATHQNEEFQDQEAESIEPSCETTSENKETKLSSEGNEEEEKDSSISQSSSTPSVLPDCLLLMMCEPKLSMEVSKETWVCSTDFIRCLPQKNNKKQLIKQQPLQDDVIKKDINNNNAASDESSKNRRVSIDLPPRPPPQLAVPPRSSCSLPAAAAVSMATMIEQKLVNAVGYEPFVLTRCKSEPMRTAAAKLAAPDSCFWTKRKLEPLRRAAYQVGAAGVGF